ncbi:hypothetical protein AQJ11_02890 [Streptomyces corchorusii]|uniref:Uncharacterized protein n=2 Tax=Streptomyces TaxID=1883 RepID=A0A117QJZ1_STRCK|nr:hypothetical protein [Streptomyces corchorusii]KUN32488.1 hypothetical protein AQJ11_02890 [Streptomyces corchorusii]
MSEITQERLNEEADYFENVAAPRAEAAAKDGERAAALTGSDHTRACASRAAAIARGRAVEYRAIAETLRAGEIPDSLDPDAIAD